MTIETANAPWADAYAAYVVANEEADAAHEAANAAYVDVLAARDAYEAAPFDCDAKAAYEDAYAAHRAAHATWNAKEAKAKAAYDAYAAAARL